MESRGFADRGAAGGLEGLPYRRGRARYHALDMPRLLLATNNAGKVIELRELLEGCGWELVTPGDLGLTLDVEESGETYAENATQKALHYAQASGLVSLADDSGLEVDALDGRPGVQSARYAGASKSDGERVEKLLGELGGCRTGGGPLAFAPSSRSRSREDASSW